MKDGTQLEQNLTRRRAKHASWDTQRSRYSRLEINETHSHLLVDVIMVIVKLKKIGIYHPLNER